jgi:hypothetical protein
MKSALRGKRGQKFLAELAKVLDEMPERKLTRDIVMDGPDVCALGAVCRARGLTVDSFCDDWDHDLAKQLGIPYPLVHAIARENDFGGYWLERDEARWARMRAWVQRHCPATVGGA